MVHKRVETKDYLSNKYKIGSHRLKLRLISEGYFEYKCYKCGLKEWNNLPAPIQLHHISGNSQDNNLSNIILLCANCHTQTENYAGKKLKKIRPINKCQQCCKVLKTNNAVKCNSCHRTAPITVSKEVLSKLIWEMTVTDISKLYKVSRTTIDRWCKYYNIVKPDDKYWFKIKYKNYIQKPKRKTRAKPDTLCPKCKIHLMWKRSKICKYCYKNNIIERKNK